MAMAEPMDFDSPSAPYKILYDANSDRKSIIIFTTEVDSNYGQVDYDLLEHMWEDVLNFDVIGIPNPSVSELDIKLNEVVAEINRQPEKHDQLAITFVGHGGCLEIVRGGRTYKHEYIELRDGTVTIEEIKRKFYTSSCTGLAGKPIHVYVSSCRGKKVEKPVLTRNASSKEEGQTSHFFTFYSSSEETVSLYDLTNGSCFVQALVSVFTRDYYTDHLITMAQKVVEEFPKFVPSGYVQSPKYESNIRELFLNGKQGQRYYSNDLPTFDQNLPQLPLPPGFNYASDQSPGQVFSAGLPEQALAKEHGRALWDAAEKGDEPTVRTLVTNDHIDVNYQKPDNFNETPLMAACRRGHQDVVTTLLSCNEINLDNTDEIGQTALMWACMKGHTTTVSALLSKGADYDLVSNSGWTALMEACSEGHTTTVSALLSKGADYDLVDNSGQTAMDYARKYAKKEAKAIVELLMKQGATK